MPEVVLKGEGNELMNICVHGDNPGAHYNILHNWSLMRMKIRCLSRHPGKFQEF